jgi:hypothetical protein
LFAKKKVLKGSMRRFKVFLQIKKGNKTNKLNEILSEDKDAKIQKVE